MIAEAQFGLLDWSVILVYFIACLAIGFYFMKRASGSTEDYFLAGRSLSWWLAGTSLVATMFAADTPLFHTANVRRFGMDAGWLFFLPGFGVVLASVLFARLWRRALVMTEIELLEIRYSGKAASVFRGVNALYGGIFQAALTMGWVTLAMGVFVDKLLGIDKVLGTWMFLGIVLIYSFASGMWGVVWTSFLQYFIATFGTIYVAVVAVIKCGGLQAMNDKVNQLTEWPGAAMRVLPDPQAWNPSYTWWLIIGWLFVNSINVATSGSFLGQKIYACKDEKHASHGVLFFGFCYYILNGWPWIITGIASLVLLGATDQIAGLSDPQETYPAMIQKILPAGMRGVMAAAMISAFMSTISTLMNWGASYMVNDFYSRFIVKNAGRRHYVWISRIFSIALLVFGGWFAFQFTDITQMLLSVSLYLTGLSLVWIFRWLWWRTNIWSEISAMIGSILVAFFVDKVLGDCWGIWQSNDAFEYYGQRLITILIGTTVIWLIVTLLTKPVDDERLKKFYKRIAVPGIGWKRIRLLCNDDCPKTDTTLSIVSTWLFGVIGLFSLLFALGYGVACRWLPMAAGLIISIVGTIGYFKLYNNLTHFEDEELEHYKF